MKEEIRNAKYCYIDLDINNHRKKLSLAASFVNATDIKYGFSSKNIRELGGSELPRIKESIELDHEYKDRYNEVDNDIQVRGPLNSRLVIELFWDASPLACENFASICNNNDISKAPIGECGKPISYVNSVIHRIIPGFMIQGGDYVFSNGSGGESIYGKKFKDEKGGLALKHDQRGVVSMGNSGKNSNTSQFFITFKASPQCDGKHVIFGKLVSGFDLLDELESIKPTPSVTITATGIYHPFFTSPAGYWYDQPDTQSYIGYTPTFVTKPRILIVLPNPSTSNKFTSILQNYAVLQFITSSSEDVNVISYLENYKVDLIFVAFSCRQYAPTSLPRNWMSNDIGNINLQNVIFVVKPVDALDALKSSWIANNDNWIFDF